MNSRGDAGRSRGLRLWVVAGGKGGTGKTVVSTGLACSLSLLGHEVILVDADLGGANLHTFLDMPKPNLTTEDLVTKPDIKVEDVVRPGPLSNLKVILGSEGLGDGKDYSPDAARALLEALKGATRDHVVIDLGAGSSPFQLAVFNRADLPVLVINPEPTSVENAYTFLKLAMLERLKEHLEDHSDISSLLKESEASMDKLIKSVSKGDIDAEKELRKHITGSTTGVVVNRVSAEASLKLAWGFASVASEHLGISVGYAGFVEEDPSIPKLLASRKFVYSPENGATIALECVKKIAKRGASGGFKTVSKKPGNPKSDNRLPLFNDEVKVGDKILHVQTEDLGPRERAVLSLVYSRGKIVFKKRLGYEELAAKAMGRAGQQERVEWFHKAIVAGVARNRISGGEAA